MQNTACSGQSQLPSCIAELLRTCVKPTTLILRIEHIAPSKPLAEGSDIERKESTTTPVSRLFLTDNVLTIQALVHPRLGLNEPLQVGNLLRVTKFEVRKAQRSKGQGKIVYLAIEDCESIQEQPIEESTYSSELAGGFVRGEDAPTVETPSGNRKRSLDAVEALTESEMPATDIDPEQSHENTSNMKQSYQPQKKRARFVEAIINVESDHNSEQEPDSDDDFETATPDMEAIQSRRRALRHLDRPVVQISNQPEPLQHTLQLTKSQLSLKTLPFHTLASLLDPPSSLPRKSYMCSILAVVTWVSTSMIHRPNSPFPPKRHIKLHDTSIQNRHTGVTLAVFVDPTTFKPDIGTIALFRGVVMHRWENDVILNAYQNLGDLKDEWCVTDRNQIKDFGQDIRALEDWWFAKSKILKTSQL